LVNRTGIRFGRHRSRFIMPPEFHSAPTNVAPMTKATSTSTAANIEIKTPKWSLKTNVNGRNWSTGKSSLLGPLSSKQSSGNLSASAFPAAFCALHSATNCRW
jgi:hypothetical protein